jgi:UDP-N-acetylmuramoyl-tripeptide--D-alanyl-D-alanine ligase
MISLRLSEAASQLGGRLHGMDVRFTGCSIDSRSLRAGNLFIAVRGSRYDGHDFIKPACENGAAAAMVERTDGFAQLPLLVLGDTRQAMTELAGYWRSGFDIPLVAVTGSNGKTTVKEMLSSILGRKGPVLATRGNLNNEIGVPLTLFGLGGEHQYAVIEMGANHAGEIAGLTRLARPTIAVITLCAPAHLQGFGSVDGVARAKAEIYSGLAGNGTAVINADDKYAGYWRDTAVRHRQITFGIDNTADISATNIRFDAATGRTGFTLHTPRGSAPVSLALAGRHNVMNALAAAACCAGINIPLEDIRCGLENTITVRGRMEMKFTKEGTRIFDDTYNANPASLDAALGVLAEYPGRRWLVLGDMGELGEYAAELHREAGESARRYGVERLYGLGENARHAVAGFGVGARHFNSPEALLDALKPGLSQDVTILVKGSRFMSMDKLVASLTGGGD